MKKKTTEQWIAEAKAVHGNKYDYSETVYRGSKYPVTIICPVHGRFEQKPQDHLMNGGCRLCGIERRSKAQMNTLDSFIEKARRIHGEKYDYSKVEYVDNRTEVTIICPEHGEFRQKPCNHLSGRGCPECGKMNYTEKRTDGIEGFVRKAREVHGDRYMYGHVNYVNSYEKVAVTCPEHGDFLVRPGDHINRSSGCPKCAAKISRAEENIFEFVKGLCPDAVQRDHSVIRPMELDIFVPSRNVAIEYNGILWHSERFARHPLLEKTELCEAKGIRLIHVFEDEWLERPEVVKSKLRHLLGCDDAVRVHGRKLSVRSVGKEAGDKFLDKYHIQGSGQATVRLGAYYNDELVAVMYFKRTDDKGRWELTRFATHDGYNVVGGAGKLFKAFVRQYDPVEVKSFADRRWTSTVKDNVYTRLGFTLAEVLKPDYRYVVNQCRVHKFNFRKRLLLARYSDVLAPDMTERQMTEKLGIYRIYDCGLLRYEWKNGKDPDGSFPSWRI